jgi:hypothetical protein
LPLFIASSTSADTGRRVIFSDIYTAVTSNKDCRTLSLMSHNAFELFASNPFARTDNPADEAGCLFDVMDRASDFRMSTVVGASARFPILLPSGNIVFKQDKKRLVTARLVDGGYYDNTSIDTLAEMLPYLRERGMRPVLIAISNSPASSRPYQLAGHGWGHFEAARSTYSSFQEVRPSFLRSAFSTFMEPLDTLISLRSAHMEAQSTELYRRKNADGYEYVPIRVMQSIYLPKEKFKGVSLCIDRPERANTFYRTLYQPIMSLSVSHLSQRSLDAQLCDYGNERMVDGILKMLRKRETAAR